MRRGLDLARINAFLLEAFHAYAAILRTGEHDYAVGGQGGRSVGLRVCVAEVCGIELVDDQAAE